MRKIDYIIYVTEDITLEDEIYINKNNLDDAKLLNGVVKGVSSFLDAHTSFKDINIAAEITGNKDE